MTAPPIPFVKGHGTGNDFVLLSNLDGSLEVGPALVAALCDRRLGIGADGVLVVARTAAHPEVATQAGTAPFFMDYRNADGSLAEMCGNGARVFAAYLREAGLVDGAPFQIATRGGSRGVQLTEDGVSVAMGSAAFLADDGISVRLAELPGGEVREAIGVLMPNPHAVTWVDHLDEAGLLADAPLVEPSVAYPDGANVEFVKVLAADHVAMRVFERGVGETLSCGTGACAAAVATRHRAGEAPSGQRVRVDVPGGTVHVLWRADGEVVLHGPVELVARGTIDPEWWARHA